MKPLLRVLIFVALKLGEVLMVVCGVPIAVALALGVVFGFVWLLDNHVWTAIAVVLAVGVAAYRRDIAAWLRANWRKAGEIADRWAK